MQVKIFFNHSPINYKVLVPHKRAFIGAKLCYGVRVLAYPQPQFYDILPFTSFLITCAVKHFRSIDINSKYMDNIFVPCSLMDYNCVFHLVNVIAERNV